MRGTKGIAVAVLCALGFSGPAGAESLSFNLRAVVPVHCQVRHTPMGAGGGAGGGAVMLGQINEYCNAPGGYQVIVSYAPGTLEGTVLSAGEDQVVLNGSGQAVLSRATGPRIRARALSATPGADGFDTDRLDFRIMPA